MRVSRMVALLVLATACSSGNPAPQAQPTPAPTASPTPRHAASASRTPSPTTSPEDPLSPKPALESPPPLGQPACKPGAVTITDADAVVGTDRWEEVFVLRTRGPACQLDGWPVVRLLGRDGTEVTANNRKTGKATPVTLSAGTSLSFTLTSGRRGSCTDIASIAITLPHTDAEQTAATDFAVCDGALAISPVQRRADEEG